MVTENVRPGYVALLRAVNVGGRNKLPMAPLRAALEEAGFSNVSTVLQSGNVLLDADAPEAEVARRVEKLIADEFGLQIGVVVRSAAELEEVASHNPFLAADAAGDPAALYVVFLADAPAPAAIALIDPDRSPPDVVVVSGREAYLSYTNGSGRTRLTLDYLERRLGTAGTTRNWRTVLRLAGRPV